MRYSWTDQNGAMQHYRDGTRYLWTLSVLAPALPGIAAVIWLSTGHDLVLFMPVAIYYGVIVLADSIIGTDPYNPPEAVLEEMASEPWYRSLLFVSVFVFWFSFLGAAFAAAQPSTALWALVLLALSAGISSGTAITVGHELGHKPDRLSQWGAMAANAVSGYGHFCIEHNRGHHIHVATPEDPASARLGESLWRFALREIPGTAVRGWQLERQRLAKKGLSFWHWRNQVLQGYGITLTADIALIVVFGWKMLIFVVIHNAVAWFHLTMANYVEHYGLLRERRENGRYGPCEPHHSWNTNHILSNLLLFHLQRHSDHHSNPLRPYQVLRSFADLPSLPSGYPGSFLLAVFPPLWFRVMDPKVMAWAGGDLEKTNLCSKRAAAYKRRHGPATGPMTASP